MLQFPVEICLAIFIYNAFCISIKVPPTIVMLISSLPGCLVIYIKQNLCVRYQLKRLKSGLRNNGIWVNNLVFLVQHLRYVILVSQIMLYSYWVNNGRCGIHQQIISSNVRTNNCLFLFNLNVSCSKPKVVKRSLTTNFKESLCIMLGRLFLYLWFELL
jgi:hypothetical protein